MKTDNHTLSFRPTDPRERIIQIDILRGFALVVFVVQVLLSWWWLRRFRFGPMEWIWRKLTYGKI